MPAWALVLIWVVVAAVALGAYLERRRGRRRSDSAIEPPTSSERAEFETRANLRGQDGPLHS
jgi:hypothetical protein